MNRPLGGALASPSAWLRLAVMALAASLVLAVAVTNPTRVSAQDGGTLEFANWPLYIDIDEETGAYPTLEAFEAESGIDVNYTEAINDNEEFFGLIQPDLAAGNPTGYDLIVPTNYLVERMVRLGYLEELDWSKLPNVEANLQDLYRNPWWDPEGKYSVPWVSGIVGIGYDPELTGRELTSFDDLFDPEFAGRVGMFADMRDTMSMTLLSMGIDPTQATVEDAEAAQQKLLEAADRGQFRQFYGNDYYDALARGDIVAGMAWSGDVTQMALYDNDKVKFIVPDTGGMLFVDNMVIPKGAENVEGAHAMIDFWYRTENAVPLIEYIGYYSPVKGVPELVQADADAARAEGDDEWADILEVVATTAVPGEDALSNIYAYPVLSEEDERIWNDLFNEVVVG